MEKHKLLDEAAKTAKKNRKVSIQLPTEKDYEFIIDTGTGIEPTTDEFETVKDYLIFKDGVSKVPFCRLMELFWDVTKTSFYASGTYLGPSVQFGLSVIFLNHMKLGFEQACLGIVTSMHFIFGLSLGWPLQEILGIKLSELYGMKSFEQMKTTLQKGYISLAIFIFLITVPVYWFSESILVAVGVDPVLSAESQDLLRLFILVHIISMGGDSIKTYCLSQGLEDYFSWMTLINVLISIGGLYAFIIELDTRAWGYLYIRLITDTITLFTSLWVYFYKVEEKSRGLGPWSTAFKEFGVYFQESLIFVIGSYAESIGYEVGSYFVALLHDNDQMAAFVNALSLSSIIYNVGISFSIVSRTRINILLGMGLPATAKHAYKFFIYCAFFVGILILAVMFPLKEQIADLFSDSTPKIREYYVINLMVYIAYIPFELSIYSIFVGVKSIHKIAHQVFFNILWLLLLNTALNYTFRRLGYESNAVWAIIFGCQAGLYFSSLVVALTSDWSEVNPEKALQSIRSRSSFGRKFEDPVKAASRKSSLAIPVPK